MEIAFAEFALARRRNRTFQKRRPRCAGQATAPRTYHDYERSRDRDTASSCPPPLAQITLRWIRFSFSFSLKANNRPTPSWIGSLLLSVARHGLSILPSTTCALAIL